MTLKHKRPPTPPEPVSAKPDNWSGPWGRINPTSSGLDAVRFCQRPDRLPEQTHSYPYRVISSWHWTNGTAQEELKIEASADLITVKGKGLDRIVEALAQGTLESLSEAHDSNPVESENPIWVSSITISQS